MDRTLDQLLDIHGPNRPQYVNTASWTTDTANACYGYVEGTGLGIRAGLRELDA